MTFFSQVFEQTYDLGNDSIVAGSFSIPNNLGSNTTIVLHVVDEADIESFKVVSSNGIIYEFPTVSDGVSMFRLRELAEVKYAPFFGSIYELTL